MVVPNSLLTYRRNGGGRFLLALPTLFLGCLVWTACGGGLGSRGATAAGWSIVLGACPAIRAERRVAAKGWFEGPEVKGETVGCVDVRDPCLGGKVAAVRDELRGLSVLTVFDGIRAVMTRRRLMRVAFFT